MVLFDAGSYARVFSPFVIVDAAGKIKVLWEVVDVAQDDQEPFGNGIYCVEGDGTIWSEPIDVIVAPGGARTFWPQHAVDDWGVLHLVWVGPNAQLYYGQVFSSEACQTRSWQTGLVAEAGQITNAAIAVDAAGVIHIAYAARDASVFYINSVNGGYSWSVPIAVSFTLPGAATAMPELAVDLEGGIHVVWEEVQLPEGVPSLGSYYAASTDGGQSWSEPLMIADGNYTQPNVAALDDGTLHLFWNGRAATRGRYHQWSADGGASWSVVTEFAGKELGGGQTGTPRYAVDSSGRLHVVTGTDETRHADFSQQRWSESQEIASYQTFGNMEHQNIVVRNGRELFVVANAVLQKIVLITGVADAPQMVSGYKPLTNTPQEPEPLITPTVLNNRLTPTLVHNFTHPDWTSSPQANTSLAPLVLGTAAALLVIILGLAWGVSSRR